MQILFGSRLRDLFRRHVKVARYRASADYDLATNVALYTASSLSTAIEAPSLSAETILWALLQDDEVTAVLGVDTALAERVERAAKFAEDPAADEHAWSRRAAAVLGIAAAKASLRSAPLSRGDLLAGMAALDGLPGEVTAGVDLTALHHDIAELTVADEVAADHEGDVDVVVVNDDATPMPFVTKIFTEVLALPPARARYAMYRVHFCGASKVATLPFDEARTRRDEVAALARAAGHPLAIRLTAVGR